MGVETTLTDQIQNVLGSARLVQPEVGDLKVAETQCRREQHNTAETEPGEI